MFGPDCFVGARYSHMARAMRGRKQESYNEDKSWQTVEQNYMLQDIPNIGEKGL